MSNDTIIGHITESNKRKSDGYTPKPSERLMLSREQDEPTAIAPEREGSVYEAVLSQKVNTTGSTEVTDLSQRPLQSPENDRTLRVETTADGEVADNALAVTDANEHTRHIERVHTESGTTKEKGLPLQAAWHEYVAVRRRFLATYKRDKKEWTKQDRKIIDTGNQTVHGGSCIIDAHICQQADAHPNDMEVYQQLYGLTPAEVLTISTLHDDIKGAVAHGKTIKSMDRHATAVANKDKTATQAFRDGFARFITELRETGITNDWDPRSGVGKAYKESNGDVAFGLVVNEEKMVCGALRNVMAVAE